MSGSEQAGHTGRVMEGVRKLIAEFDTDAKRILTVNDFSDHLDKLMRHAFNSGATWGKNNSKKMEASGQHDHANEYKRADDPFKKVTGAYVNSFELNEKLTKLERTEARIDRAAHRRRLLFTLLHSVVVAAVLLGTYKLADCWDIPLPLRPAGYGPQASHLPSTSAATLDQSSVATVGPLTAPSPSPTTTATPMPAETPPRAN